jgi:hypothetical protein
LVDSPQNGSYPDASFTLNFPFSSNLNPLLSRLDGLKPFIKPLLQKHQSPKIGAVQSS